MKGKFYLRFFLLLMMGLFTSLQISFAQGRKVSGLVTDATDGTGLPGVSVTVKGSSKGAVTDNNGKFTVDVNSPNDVLVFSFVGYHAQEVTVGAQNVINISLVLDATNLSELVVTGYTSQSRKDISTAVTIVDTKDMKKIAASNFAEQLQGKVAGVTMSTTGDPGSTQFVRIRGIGSINNNEPLYVIDGVPVQNEANMNFLNPNDIESMQVLKDAASASIYGSRAANGVVVITTKKGKAGKSKIGVDVWTGISQPGKVLNSLANSDEYMQIKVGGVKGANLNPGDVSKIFLSNGGWNFTLPDYYVSGIGYKAGDPAVDPSKYVLPPAFGDKNTRYLINQTNKLGTDWFNEVYKPAQSTNYQVSASGGSEKGNYYLSGNFFDNKGILILNDYKRYQTRLNSNFNIRKNVRIGENLNFAYENTRGSMGRPTDGSVLKNVYSAPPIVPVSDINNFFGSLHNLGNASNPVAQQTRNRRNSDGYGVRLTGNMFLDVDFLKNFTYSTNFGLDFGVGHNEGFNEQNFEVTEVNESYTLSNSTWLNRNWVYYNIIKYKNNFGSHHFDGLVGQEAKNFWSQGFNVSGAMQSFSDPNFRTMGNTNPKTLATGSYKGLHTMSSIFASGNYNFADKYYASATIRRDGSSRFLNHKYGIFPSGSVAWRISKESFMTDLAAVTDLKLRTSYGIVGNNEVLGGDYPGFSNFGSDISTSAYDLTGTGNSAIPGFNQTSTGNPDLKWESTALFNVGVDLNLFNKISTTLEWYTRNTTDMIYPVELPLESGSNGRKNTNIGSMKNTGIDLQINYNGKVNNDLNYNVGLTASGFRNKVLALDANSSTFVTGGGSRIGDITYTTIGAPISQFRGYQVDGLWKTQDEIKKVLFADPGDAKVGRYKYVDQNKDGKIGTEDLVNIGNPLPKFSLGLNLGLNYKNFDFTAYLNGVYGYKIFNFMHYWTDFYTFDQNRGKDMLYEAGKTHPVLDQSDVYSSQINSTYV
ncbi:MAG: SusC/RagA family TonB-linked outer membrane protein [Bacteroidetes bacterium]|nr:SusC/RagA family TonB-linked outer membrane protein [Bacteroidota bacterium]